MWLSSIIAWFTNAPSNNQYANSKAYRGHTIILNLWNQRKTKEHWKKYNRDETCNHISQKKPVRVLKWNHSTGKNWFGPHLREWNDLDRALKRNHTSENEPVLSPERKEHLREWTHLEHTSENQQVWIEPWKNTPQTTSVFIKYKL